MRFSRAPGKAGDRFKLVVRTDEHGKPTGWNGRYIEIPEKLADPLKARRPTCYFVNSMSDLFGEGVSDEYIAAVFGVMAACPQHRFQVLTKRAERMAAWFEHVTSAQFTSSGDGRGESTAERCRGFVLSAIPGSVVGDGGERRYADNVAPLLGYDVRWPLPNVWIGVSVEDQQRADERIPHLLRVPATVRFLSVEPMLGPIDLDRGVRLVGGGNGLPLYINDVDADRVPNRHVDWVIVGGESGPGARPFNVAWGRSIVEQCRAAGVAVFMKQLGAYPVDASRESSFTITGAGPVHMTRDRKGGDMAEWPEDLRVRQWPAPTERTSTP
jgi:protein gp37